MSSQRIGKYACLELERRYLLRELPADLRGREGNWQIVDRYLSGTRLRLRWMASPSKGTIILKLTQKYREAGQEATETIITNMYLNKAEYNCLSQLPGPEIIKKRYEYRQQAYHYSIDVFEGPLLGLILAEIEAETTADLAAQPFPTFALKEVTADPFFSGGALAGLTEAEFREGFAQRINY
jgi:CYTH domain-containing protein